MSQLSVVYGPLCVHLELYELPGVQRGAFRLKSCSVGSGGPGEAGPTRPHWLAGDDRGDDLDHELDRPAGAEQSPAHHETYIYWSMIIGMTRRLARQPSAIRPTTRLSSKHALRSDNGPLSPSFCRE